MDSWTRWRRSCSTTRPTAPEGGTDLQVSLLTVATRVPAIPSWSLKPSVWPYCFSYVAETVSVTLFCTSLKLSVEPYCFSYVVETVSMFLLFLCHWNRQYDLTVFRMSLKPSVWPYFVRLWNCQYDLIVFRMSLKLLVLSYCFYVTETVSMILLFFVCRRNCQYDLTVSVCHWNCQHDLTGFFCTSLTRSV